MSLRLRVHTFNYKSIILEDNKCIFDICGKEKYHNTSSYLS